MSAGTPLNLLDDGAPFAILAPLLRSRLPSGDFKAMSQHRGRAAFLLEFIYRLIPAVL